MIEKLIKIAVLALTEFRFAQRMTSKFPAAAACAVAAFLASLGTVGCMVAAFWLYIAPSVGEAGAALWSAVLLLAISAALGLGARLGFRAGLSRDSAAPSEAFSTLSAKLGETLAQGKSSVLLSALLAGLACGRK